MRPPKTDCIFEISIKKYVGKETQNNKNLIHVINEQIPDRDVLERLFHWKISQHQH